MCTCTCTCISYLINECIINNKQDEEGSSDK